VEHIFSNLASVNCLSCLKISYFTCKMLILKRFELTYHKIFWGIVRYQSRKSVQVVHFSFDKQNWRETGSTWTDPSVRVALSSAFVAAVGFFLELFCPPRSCWLWLFFAFRPISPRKSGATVFLWESFRNFFWNNSCLEQFLKLCAFSCCIQSTDIKTTFWCECRSM